ncbi:MAG: hypothetical protein GY725_23745 [bacterium]|nr:hypothetical protein [bacterium]
MDRRPSFPSTSLRRRYERSSGLNLRQQMGECVDYLQNPEVLVAEFVDSYCAVEAYCADDEMVFRPADPATSPEMTVLDRPPYTFRCLAWEFSPLAPPKGSENRPGLDYAGLITGPHPAPVLGAVQSVLDPTPYLVLLRMLSCVAELAPVERLKMADTQLFKGALGEAPAFDLHLVLSACQPDREHLALGELTRDLADVFFERIADEWQFPDVLRHAIGLRRSGPNPDAPLHVDWLIEALPL